MNFPGVFLLAIHGDQSTRNKSLIVVQRQQSTSRNCESYAVFLWHCYKLLANSGIQYTCQLGEDANKDTCDVIKSNNKK